MRLPLTLIKTELESMIDLQMVEDDNTLITFIETKLLEYKMKKA